MKNEKLFTLSKCKYLVLIILCSVFFSSESFGQQFIGMHKSKMNDAVHTSLTGFYKNFMITRQTFNYLKYINGALNQTYIFFFNEENICTSSQLISEYAHLSTFKTSFNEKYKRISDNTWEYKYDRQKYIVTIKLDNSFFTVITKKKI